MSRGLGRRQRDILAALEQSPEGAKLAITNATHSESVALRRAANTLQRRGLVRIGHQYSNARIRMTVALAGTGAAA